MNESPTKRLPKNDSFETRVLSELGAIRSELGAFRVEQAAILSELGAFRVEQAAILSELGAFRVEQTAILSELGAFRVEQAAILSELARIRADQAATRKDIAALDSRLGSLEELVDARLRETRPIWEAVQQDITRLDTKFDNIIRDLYDVRTDIRLHDKRLFQLEDSR